MLDGLPGVVHSSEEEPFCVRYHEPPGPPWGLSGELWLVKV